MAIRNEWASPSSLAQHIGDLQYMKFTYGDEPIYIFIIEGSKQTLFPQRPHFEHGLNIESKYFQPRKRYFASFSPKNRIDIVMSELQKEILDLKSMILRQRDVNTHEVAELISLKTFYARLNDVIFPTAGILSSLMLFIVSLSFLSGLAQTLALLSSLILLGFNLRPVMR